VAPTEKAKGQQQQQQEEEEGGGNEGDCHLKQSGGRFLGGESSL
jgi:hypothetical protein